MNAFAAAWTMIASGDPALVSIVLLSVKVSLSAVAIAAMLGAPFGAVLAVFDFPGRRLLVVLTTTFMALPPVVAGLCIYLLLSRAGPLGPLGLLYTPSAMIIAQTVLIFPIIAALTREAVLPVHRDYAAMLTALDAGPGLTMRTLLWDARYAIATAVLAGFGRAIAEVGAVLIVGGNIDGLTRVMTTTIALETSRGNLEIALALGIVLMALAFLVNFAIHAVNAVGRRFQVAR